ncbi:hypothetical protein [Pseudoxanthomonas sp. UTMC 1351]|uniref:hypothetical protein n=1 Tax=Pseudoxanthomonas sp. UTMC 1351 TaxID=2695853 RepID=UPI0034CF94C8
MPRIVDRTTGRYLGTLTEQESKQLMALFDEPTRTDEPFPFDPDLIDDLAESGASAPLLAMLRQILQGKEDLDIDVEPD